MGRRAERKCQLPQSGKAQQGHWEHLRQRGPAGEGCDDIPATLRHQLGVAHGHVAPMQCDEGFPPGGHARTGMRIGSASAPVSFL